MWYRQTESKQGSNRLHTIVAVETLNFGFHSESNALADLIFAPENKISDVILYLRGMYIYIATFELNKNNSR